MMVGLNESQKFHEFSIKIALNFSLPFFHYVQNFTLTPLTMIGCHRNHVTAALHFFIAIYTLLILLCSCVMTL